MRHFHQMKHRKFVSFGEVVSFGGRAMVYSPFIEPPNEISHQMKDSPNRTSSPNERSTKWNNFLRVSYLCPLPYLYLHVQQYRFFKIKRSYSKSNICLNSLLSINFIAFKMLIIVWKKTVFKKNSFRVLACATSHARHLYVCTFCRVSTC